MPCSAKANSSSIFALLMPLLVSIEKWSCLFLAKSIAYHGSCLGALVVSVVQILPG